MERKKIQRIIGILVIIALIIILLPLLFNKNQRTRQEETVAAIAPPPFPIVQEEALSDQSSAPQPVESDLSNVSELRELKDPPIVKYTKNENKASKLEMATNNATHNATNNIAAKKNLISKKATSSKKATPHLASVKHITSAKLITASIRKSDIYHAVHKPAKISQIGYK